MRAIGSEPNVPDVFFLRVARPAAPMVFWTVNALGLKKYEKGVRVNLLTGLLTWVG